MSTIQMGTDGHVSDHEVVWQKKSNCLGIPYKITVTHGTEVEIEQDVASDSKYHEIEELVADATVYAVHEQWLDVAKTAAAILVEGAKLNSPETAQTALIGIQIVQAIQAKNWAQVESLIGPFLADLIQATPELKKTMAALKG